MGEALMGSRIQTRGLQSCLICNSLHHEWEKFWINVLFWWGSWGDQRSPSTLSLKPGTISAGSVGGVWLGWDKWAALKCSLCGWRRSWEVFADEGKQHNMLWASVWSQTFVQMFLIYLAKQDLHWRSSVFIVAFRIFSYGTWDLVPWPGIEPLTLY